MLLKVITRTLHIAATCTSLGGLAYARLVLLPSLDRLPVEEREPFERRVIKQYSYIKWAGVATVACTGVISWLETFPRVKQRRAYLAAFGLKMSGALGLLTITAQLALPGERFARIQERRAFWSGVNLVCAVTILSGAALMRTIRQRES